MVGCGVYLFLQLLFVKGWRNAGGVGADEGGAVSCQQQDEGQRRRQQRDMHGQPSSGIPRHSVPGADECAPCLPARCRPTHGGPHER